MSKICIDTKDITTLCIDCIVNAANATLLGGGGVDGAIHRAAGTDLDKYCVNLNGCPTGCSKITPGFNLNAKYIIHTVGPIYNSYTKKKAEKLLKSCYLRTLDLAKKNNIHSIAFPAISCGIYKFPIDKATKIAYNTVRKWILKNKKYDILVIFSCIDKEIETEYRKYIS